MPEFHAEPYIYLAGLSHKSALIAWGHNFQHSHWNGIDYFISGAGSKIRSGAPGRTEEAHTVSWAPVCHFLLVTIAGSRMTVRAIGESDEGLADIERFDVGSNGVSGPIVVTANR